MYVKPLRLEDWRCEYMQREKHICGQAPPVVERKNVNFEFSVWLEGTSNLLSLYNKASRTYYM